MAKKKPDLNVITKELEKSKSLWEKEINTQLSKLEKQFTEAKDDINIIIDALTKEFIPIWKKKINWWKAYKQIAIDRKLLLSKKEKEWMTNVVTPLTYVMVNALAQKIYGLSYNSPIEWSKKWANDEALQLFIEKMQESAKTTYKLKKFSRNSITFGDAFMRVWILSDLKIEEEKDEKLKKAKLKTDDGKAKLLTDYLSYNEVEDFTSILYDTSCNFYESEFVVWRKIRSVHKFFKRWKSQFDAAWITKDFLISIAKQKVWGFFWCDYERYKRLEYHTEEVLDKYNAFGYTTRDFMNMPKFSEFFAECVEKYTETSITLCVNGTPLISFDNYYYKKSNGQIMHPLLKLSFDDEVDAPVSKSLPENLHAVQALHDVVFNSFADQIKLSLSPMFKVDDNLTVEWFDSWYLEVDPYKILKLSGTGEMSKFDIGQVDANVFTMLDYLYSLALIISGINRYTGGWGESWWIERSATASNLLLQATQDTLRPIVDWLNFSLNRMSKIFIIEWQEKLPTKFILTGSDDKEHTIELKGIDSLESELTFINEIINQYNREQVFNNLVSVLDRTKEYIANAGDNYPGLNLRGLIKELYKTAWMERFALSLEEAITLTQDTMKVLEKKWVAPVQNWFDQWWWVPWQEEGVVPPNEEVVLDQSSF